MALGGVRLPETVACGAPDALTSIPKEIEPDASATTQHLTNTESQAR